MSEFLQNLLTASIHGSIVILAVILLRLLLRKTPKKYICLLWLLAGIRLLMPIAIRSELSLQPEFTLPGWNLPALLPWVWGAVAVCFAVYSLLSYLKLKNQVREAVRIRGGWECDKIETAFILGFIKPRIYIPMGMNRQARKHILAHERTHLDKGDHWIKMIGFLALTLHWFNPLVWIAYILLCKDIEMACDERVVQFMELEERKSYSAALLSCSSRQMHFAASPVAFGEVSVKQRILSILNYKKPAFWAGLLGVVAFFFVAVCLLTSPAVEPETVIVEIPAEKFTPNTPDEVSKTIERLDTAWDVILSQNRYHLFFSDETYDGSVGWQINVYKDGENTLWKSTDHMTEEGHMVLDGVHYKFIDGNDGGWVPYEESDTMLDSMLEYFHLDGKVITDIQSEVKTNEAGYTYELLTFNTHYTDETGSTVSQPRKVYFDTDGNMTGMRVENVDRKGADIFSFSNFSLYTSFNNIDDVYRIAKESIIPVENVHPSKLQEPTQDELRMKEWGIQYRVDDDLLTQYGSEVWFCQSEGYDMTVHTDNEYWLEKKTDTGWEKLEMIAEPEWESANYTLGHGMYTMTFVDWSKLYGPLNSGTYRMGKRFEKVTNGSQTCIGYAEFEIFHNEAATADQTAAVERCYAELEELTKRDHLHWKSIMGSDTYEYWVNGEDYLRVSHFSGSDMPYEEWDDYQKSLFPRTDTSVRYKGIGYSDAREDPERLSSKVLGMQLATLSPDRGGWTWTSLTDDFNYSFFTRSNHNITFPDGVGVISDEMVRFVVSWSLGEGLDYVVHITYKFDENGDLYYMAYKPMEEGRKDVYTIEVFDDTAEGIDAKIKPYTENLIVPDFSWNDAKAKYTDEEFNIREDSFVNNGGTAITGPVDAAKLALKEYPNLGDYLSLDVFRDETTGMWKVTIESYVDYQSTYGYRDVYISDSGATQLLVYEGPIEYDQTRK